MIVSTVVREARPGGIFVFHMHGAPDAPATDEALPRVIRKLHRRGYRFVTLSQLFGREPADAFFRIGHMGHVNAHMVLGVLGAIEAGLAALGIPHDAGGVAAAARVLAGPG